MMEPRVVQNGRKWSIEGVTGWADGRTFPTKWKAEIALEISKEGGRFTDYTATARLAKTRRGEHRSPPRRPPMHRFKETLGFIAGAYAMGILLTFFFVMPVLALQDIIQKADSWANFGLGDLLAYLFAFSTSAIIGGVILAPYYDAKSDGDAADS